MSRKLIDFGPNLIIDGSAPAAGEKRCKNRRHLKCVVILKKYETRASSMRKQFEIYFLKIKSPILFSSDLDFESA